MQPRITVIKQEIVSGLLLRVARCGGPFARTSMAGRLRSGS